MAKRIALLLLLAFPFKDLPAKEGQSVNERVSEEDKYRAANQLLDRFYNYSEWVEETGRSKESAWELVQKYPDDPYMYDIWATIELVLISRELGLKIDEPKNILETPEYKERIENYYKIVGQGLALTENQKSHKFLLARAALFFDQAKFSAKFEGWKGLSKADAQSAAGIKTLKEILADLKDFCPAYLFLGGSRFQLASKTSAWTPQRLYVRNFSSAYAELWQIDSDVFSKEAAIKWLEKVWNCGFQELYFKKMWLESGFALANAYSDLRKEMSVQEEKPVLTKELELLKQLKILLPNNNDIGQKLALAEIRIKF